MCEVASIDGIDERTQRSIGINLTGGHVNATEICTRLYKAPTFDTLLADFQAELEGLDGVSADSDDVIDWIDDGSGDSTFEEDEEDTAEAL